MAEKKNPLFGLAEGAGPNDQSPDYSNSIEQFLNGLLGPGWQQNPMADYALNQVWPSISGEWQAGENLRNIGTAVSDVPMIGNLLGPILYGLGGMQQAGAVSEPAVQQGTNILNTVASAALAPPGRPPLLPGMQPVDFTSNLQNLTNLAPDAPKPTSGNPALDAMLYMGSAVNVPDLTDLAVKAPIAAAKLAPALGKVAPSLAALSLSPAAPSHLRRWLDEAFSSKKIDISNQAYGHVDDLAANALHVSMFHDIDEFITSADAALRSVGLEGRGKYLNSVNPSHGYSPGLIYSDPSGLVEFQDPIAHVQLYQRSHAPDEIDSLTVGINIVQKDPTTGKYKKVGRMSRTFHPPSATKGPEAVVDHGYFEINAKLQGQGLAKKVLRGAIDYYTRKGISRINVNAGMDNGGYTWLRFGFRPQGSDLGLSTYRLKDRLRSLIDDPRLLKGEKRPLLHPEITNKSDPLYGLRVPLNEDEIRLINKTIESDDPRALWALADSDVGWDMLNGQTWSGHVDLTNPEQLDRWLSYVGDSIDMDGVTDTSLQNLKHLTDPDSLWGLQWTTRPGSIPPARLVNRPGESSWGVDLDPVYRGVSQAEMDVIMTTGEIKSDLSRAIHSPEQEFGLTPYARSSATAKEYARGEVNYLPDDPMRPGRNDPVYVIELNRTPEMRTDWLDVPRIQREIKELSTETAKLENTLSRETNYTKGELKILQDWRDKNVKKLEELRTRLSDYGPEAERIDLTEKPVSKWAEDTERWWQTDRPVGLSNVRRIWKRPIPAMERDVPWIDVTDQFIPPQLNKPTEYTLADLPHISDPEEVGIEALGQWMDDPYFLSKIKRGEKVRVYKYLHNDEIATTGPTILPGDVVFLDPEDARNAALANRRGGLFSSVTPNTAEYEGMVMRSSLVDPRSLPLYTGNETLVGGMLSQQSPVFHFWPRTKQEGWELVQRQLGPWHRSRADRKFAFATRADREIPVHQTGAPGSILWDEAASPVKGGRGLFVQDSQILRKPSGQPYNLSLPDDLAFWSDLLSNGQTRDYYSSLGWGAVEAIDGNKKTYMVLDEDLIGKGSMRTQHYLAQAQRGAAQSASAPTPAAQSTGGLGGAAAQGAPLQGTLGPGVPAGAPAPGTGGITQWRRGTADHSIITYDNLHATRQSGQSAAASRPQTVTDDAFRMASASEDEIKDLLEEAPYGRNVDQAAADMRLRSGETRFVGRARPNGQSATGRPFHEAPPANSRTLDELWEDPDFVEVVPITYSHATRDPLGHNGQYMLNELFSQHRYRLTQNHDAFLIPRSTRPWVDRSRRPSHVVHGVYARLDDGRVIPFFYLNQSWLTQGQQPDRILGQAITRRTDGSIPLATISDQQDWLRLLQTQLLNQQRMDGTALSVTQLPPDLRRDLGNPHFYPITYTMGNSLP